MKFRFKRQKNKSGMMNKNKRTKNLNGRMKFKVKIMKCSFSGKQLNQIWNSHTGFDKNVVCLAQEPRDEAGS